ncbi:MAG: rRNA maturation RNase YbeY [Bacteroidales bacterium]|nr:rRNA maturation RNase YbeY [Bacteroidales bacterium]
MIRYHIEDIQFKLLHKRILTSWIKRTIQEKMDLGELNFIFCSDDYLLNINKQYLNHNYYTDVITFDYCNQNILSGDIFISLDTVRENSKEYSVSFDNELYRVMIHGVLHLLGFDDKSDIDKVQMKNAEDEALLSLQNILK